jgi:hypothetical protein
MRSTVGVLGILVPLVLIIGEVVLSGWSRMTLRGSISAYYHSPMQDFFVASLCVIAFLLMTYMGGHPQTRDFWCSLAAGLFLLGVVFFPTWLSHSNGEPFCGGPGVPPRPGCSPIEQAWGEASVAHIHQMFAILFILSLALMSLLFARDEDVVQGNPKMRRVQRGFAIAILVSGAWAVIGPTMGPIDKLWLGEVGAIWSFALSWLLKGAKVSELFEAPKPHPPGSTGLSRNDVLPTAPVPPVPPVPAPPTATVPEQGGPGGSR